MEEIKSVWTVCFFMFLFVACLIDIKEKRIPNWLNLAGLLVAVPFLLYGSTGAHSILDAIYGLIICFLIFIPFYILGGMGAGDVKMISVIGFMLGLQGGVLAAAFALVAGSFIGLSIVFSKGDIRQVFPYCYGVVCGFFNINTSSNQINKSNKGNIGQTRFPYAVAIATGASISTAINWIS